MMMSAYSNSGLIVQKLVTTVKDHVFQANSVSLSDWSLYPHTPSLQLRGAARVASVVHLLILDQNQVPFANLQMMPVCVVDRTF